MENDDNSQRLPALIKVNMQIIITKTSTENRT
jgi:hypothetical protein